MHKLDNPDRVAELSPPATLRSIGVHPGSVFCDIGAGTGVFTIPAAQLTGGPVYAIDVSADMLAIIEEKCRMLGITSVTTILPSAGHYPIEDGTCDVALMCTVLHDIVAPAPVLCEVRRVLKSGGRLAVIEFRKEPTRMGPPVARRLSEPQTQAMLEEIGFNKESRHDIGTQFYMHLYSIS